MQVQNFVFVRNEIKQLLKSRRIKYSALAKPLGLSKSGIKKMLNAKDLSFNKICSILDATGINVTDFFQALGQPPVQEKKLTPQQEEFLVRNPSFYHFFHQLMNFDLDWRRLKEIHNLNQKSVDQYLLKLDKLGLIELHPSGVVKSEYVNCRLTFGMKLIKKVVDNEHRAILNFAHIPNEKFRGRKHVANGFLRMKPATASEFNAALREVVAEYMNRSKRESILEPTHQMEDIGFLIVVTPTEGKPLDRIPNL